MKKQLFLLFILLLPAHQRVIAWYIPTNNHLWVDATNTLPQKHEVQQLIKASRFFTNRSYQKANQLADKAVYLAQQDTQPLLMAEAQMAKAHILTLLHQNDSATWYNQLAYEAYLAASDTLGMARVYARRGALALNTDDLNKARYWLKRAEGMLHNLKAISPLAATYNYLGHAFIHEGNFAQALIYFNQAYELSATNNLTTNQLIAQGHLARTFYLIGDYLRASDFAMDVLISADSLGNTNALASAYTQLGLVAMEQEEWKRAINYFNQALEKRQQLGDLFGTASLYQHLASLHTQKGKYDKAARYAKQALPIKESLEKRRGMANSLNQLAEIFFQTNKWDSAWQYMSQAYQINQALQYETGLYSSRLIKANLLLGKKQIQAAQNELKKAQQYALENGLNDKVALYKAFMNLYLQQKNYQRAFDYQDLYYQNKANLASMQAKRVSQANEMRFELEKKQKEIEQLSERQAIQTRLIKEQHTLRNLLLIVASILLALLVWGFYLYRGKMKQSKEMALKNEQIEQHRSELQATTDELLKLSIVADRAENGVLITNADGYIEWANEGLFKMYGYTWKDLFNKENKGNIQHVSTNKKIHEILKQIAVLQEPLTYQSHTHTRYGKDLYTQTTVSPVIDEKGHLEKIVFIDSDITEQIIAQRSLKKTINTKDKFLSIIAHDLKASFANILSFARLMNRNFSSLPDNKKHFYARTIELAANRGTDLLTNLLHWARTQEGRLDYQPEKTDMNELVQSVISLYSSQAMEKHITLARQTPDYAWAYCDANMIDTVLRNLITNAIKFTHARGWINVSVRQLAKHTLEIAVQDNGVGISPTDQAKIFKDINYSTIGTAKELGTGLGLVLCKEFVEQNKGEIRLESSEGQGSSFIFTLPAWQPDQEDDSSGIS